MKTCLNCQNPIPNWIVIEGKRRNLQKRKFCTVCSPFGVHNTRDIRRPRSKRGSYEGVKRFRRKRKELAVAYLGGQCAICGYSRCLTSLVFHHRDPALKAFTISNKSKAQSFKRIKPELDKCVLLCSNCHGEVHAGLATI